LGKQSKVTRTILSKEVKGTLSHVKSLSRSHTFSDLSHHSPHVLHFIPLALQALRTLQDYRHRQSEILANITWLCQSL